MLGGDASSASGTEQSSDSPADSSESLGPKASESELLGTWVANRDDGSSFELSLSKSGEFTWAYGKGGEQQKIAGVFVVDDGVLAMEPDSGGVMLADVTKPENDQFKFRQNGTGGDTLVFAKK